ncbi:MAG: tRNA-intron lyase [Thermoplasmata archaeon]|nr:tRNA-intron lyase [Thermoplasmata archaeon]
MEAILEKDIAIINNPSEASQIYNKGHFGEPQSGGSLVLDLFETAYLLEFRKFELKDADGRTYTLQDMINYGSKKEKTFEIKYIVYRDMRTRGYVLKKGNGEIHFLVYPRGSIPTKTPAKFWMLAISERQVFDYGKLYSLLEAACAQRKEVLLGVVDEESDITYYSVKNSVPKGGFTETGEPMATGVFIEDRVMVFDENESRALYSAGFYGHMVGTRLQLSLTEAYYLCEEGRLRVMDARSQKELNVGDFLKKCRKIQKDFDERLRVYRELKSRNLIVKTGFKYGTHFRAYEDDPDKTHAKYLVHALKRNYRGSWPDISGAVRLAHGVRKTIVFAGVGEQKITYLSLERTRP